MKKPKRVTDQKPAETRIEQFARSFKNESDLRTALIALLELMPGNKNVRLTHGSNELGKDIVFNFPVAFDRGELVACVVKNQPITGSSESSNGTRNVANQAEMCLDTPILNHLGNLESVARVFIITPFECDHYAIASVSGRLQRLSSEVRFIFGRELYELFEKYYPDYLLFRSGMFGTYVADLEKGISSDAAIINVLLRHGLAGAKDVNKVYVQPKFTHDIKRFRLLIKHVVPERLRGEVSETDVAALGNSLIHLSRVLAAVGSPGEYRGYRIAATSFAREIRKLWQHSFEQDHRSTISASDSATRRATKITLPDAEAWANRLGELILIPSSLSRELAISIERANDYADEPALSFTFLSTCEEAKPYSFVEGLSIQQPNLISSVDSGISISCSSAQILESEMDWLLTGPAGFGKTSFCRWNVLNDLRMLKEGKSSIVPIYLPLHRLSGIAMHSTEATLLDLASARVLWDSRGEGEGSRKFRFYLDGLDEVPNQEEQIHLVALALKLKEESPHSQIIVTGREHVAGLHTQRFIRLHVQEMDDAKLDEFIRAWFSQDPTQIENFQRQMERFPSLRQVMRAPLLATLVLSVYVNTHTVPESRARLYDMFVGLMAGGWDVAKRIQRETQFGPQPKITVLQYLAGRLQLSSKRDASFFDFGQAVRDQLPALYDRRDALITEITHDGLLVPIGDGFAFAHLSFQEYLAAKDLVEPSGRRALNALTAYLRGNDWWRETLGFYVTLSDQPRAMEIFVREQVHKIARRISDERVVERGVYLLERVALAYPDARPNLEFPELLGLFRQRSMFDQASTDLRLIDDDIQGSFEADF